MEYQFALFASVGLFLAGEIKGVTGLGYSTCALPFLVAVFGLKEAMAIVLLPAMATNITVAISAGHFAEVTRRFSRLYLSMVPGILVGVSLLTWLSQVVAVKFLGMTILIYSLWALLKPSFFITQEAEKLMAIPVGFINGIVTGLTGSQVMPLFPCIMALSLETTELVQAINIAVMGSSVLLMAAFIFSGTMTSVTTAFSVIAIAPTLAGVKVGNGLRLLIPSQGVRKIALYTLTLSGVLMLMR